MRALAFNSPIISLLKYVISGICAGENESEEQLLVPDGDKDLSRRMIMFKLREDQERGKKIPEGSRTLDGQIVL